MNEMTEIADPSGLAPDAHELRQSPARFVNREVSWLQFNMRVLEEAGNTHHPLLERLRFVSISANNLDEFFMVRVAGLKGQQRAGLTKLSADGLTPVEQLEEIANLAQHLHLEQQDHWQQLREELFAANVVIHEADDLSPEQVTYLQKLYREEIFPVLTPIAVDPAHPFPFIPNLGFTLAFEMVRPGTTQTLTALVRVPSNLDRFVTLPKDLTLEARVEVVTIDTMINLFITKMFPHHPRYRDRNRRRGGRPGGGVRVRPAAAAPWPGDPPRDRKEDAARPAPPHFGAARRITDRDVRSRGFPRAGRCQLDLLDRPAGPEVHPLHAAPSRAGPRL